MPPQIGQQQFQMILFDQLLLGQIYFQVKMKRTEFINKLMQISELNNQYNSLKDMPLFCVRPAPYSKNAQTLDCQNKRHQIYSHGSNRQKHRQKTQFHTSSTTHSSQKLNSVKKRRIITQRTQTLIKKKEIGSISLHVRQTRRGNASQEKKNEYKNAHDEQILKEDSGIVKGESFTNIICIEGTTFNSSNFAEHQYKSRQMSFEVGKRRMTEEKDCSRTLNTREMMKAEKVRFYRQKKLLTQTTIPVFQPTQKRSEISARSSIQNERQKEKINKISLLRQINKNYRKAFLPPPKITAKSYIISQIYPNTEQKIISSFSSKLALEIASLTKIMTCTLTLQVCKDFNVDKSYHHVVVGKTQTTVGGTSAQLLYGQIYSIHQLLFGLMLPSGNDASVALAIWAGSLLLSKEGEIIKKEEMQLESNTFVGKVQKIAQRQEQLKCYNRFIKEMNVKASQLKMSKTTYANSHGLANPQNKSSAFDLSLLCQYAMRNPEFRKIVHKKQYTGIARKTVPDQKLKAIKEEAKPRTIQWQNTHKLMQIRPKQYIGIKTGFTKSAGPCLSSCVSANGRQFLIIILNCQKVSLRFKETEILKKWLFKHLKLKKHTKKWKQGKTEQTEDELQGQEGIDQSNFKRIIAELKQERQQQD